jgi:hypothetical protein
MLRPRPDFARSIDQLGISRAEFARRSGVSTSAIYALADPSQQPERKGAVRPWTAWKIAKAVATLTGESAEAAFDRLFVADTPAETPL